MRAVTCCLVLGAAASAGAQSCAAGAPAFVGSEWEQYLRIAQVSGRGALEPWTIRQLGPRQIRRVVPTDSTLPWRSRNPDLLLERCGTARTYVLTPRLQTIHNTGFPLSFNDGAVWAGRGVTAALDAGVSAAIGPLTVTLAPMVFTSQNVNFTTKANGLTGERAFADWRNPQYIDLPQRFGSAAYTRFDPGQSSIRLDFPLIALGISTANQFLGPAYDHPIILGNNAAGFPHVFLGSSSAIRIWKLGSISGRVFWGKLEQSPYSPLADSSYERLGSGFTAVLQPGGMPNLEIGATRFVHVLQDRFRINRTEIFRPFGFLVGPAPGPQSPSTVGNEPENQLASLFARLVLPASGVEIYGEYGREDRNQDMRELIYFLDHDSAYLLGLRKLWVSNARVLSVRAEVLNSRVTHLALSSNQAPWYVHTPVYQGHTHRGQALGSSAAYGGGGSVLAVDLYRPTGRWRVEWHRFQLAETREPAPDLFRSDVAHMLSASMLRFGGRADLEIGAAAIAEFNRYFERDTFGVRWSVSVRPSARRSG